jgi:serine/threonine-protein kinase RsbT
MTELDVVVAIECADDIVTARQAGRDMATKLDFSLTDVTMITTAISEVARNISKYADHGEIRLNVTTRRAHRALMVQAVDHGPGIANPDQALEDGFSTGKGLGLGLPGSRRLMDDFQLESTLGEGTTVTMWKWLPPGV